VTRIPQNAYHVLSEFHSLCYLWIFGNQISNLEFWPLTNKMLSLQNIGAVLAFLASIDIAAAQGAAYAQCGGSGFSGPTTCVSGYVCTYSK